ncbi:MAG: response regulator [Gemmatimonadales bacterium]|nr:response regulator [Gemmatimonadales bacterium]NIN50512.1 response regulator [Gemmatimonadales bacterium]NIP07976.1 response regulator [Gemmatimonadales bacterium]NIR01998.1 response regulator [Gemmatimonadales bacterium]NIS65864.1 response regulator [Gemmatimonadales bacterium]
MSAAVESLTSPRRSGVAGAVATTAASQAYPVGTETILVVDDDLVLRRAARRALEMCGYTVLLAGDAEEALEAFPEGQSDIDLVITDVVMSGVGGRELYAALKQRCAGVKVLFTSGYSSAPLEGDVPFLQKPWTLNDLAVRVRQVLDEAHS